MSIRCTDDDAILLHCFAGCATAEVVRAAGLELADLFPPRRPGLHSSRPRASALTALVANFERDLLIVHLLLADLAQAKPISRDDCATAKTAAARIWSALQEARHVI